MSKILYILALTADTHFCMPGIPADVILNFPLYLFVSPGRVDIPKTFPIIENVWIYGPYLTKSLDKKKGLSKK